MRTVAATPTRPFENLRNQLPPLRRATDPAQSARPTVGRFSVGVAITASLIAGCGLGGSVESSFTPVSVATPHSTAPASTTGSVQSSDPTTGQASLALRPGLPPLVEGEAAACLPICANGLSRPGSLPVGTPYQTLWFFGGYLTLVADTEWSALEDSTGELKIAPTEDLEYGAGFALDLFPVARGKRVDDVSNTSADLLAWLTANPNLTVSEPISSAIGALPATYVDIRLSPSAEMEHPDCGAPCVDFLSFEQWDHANGIFGDDVYGLYLSDLEFNGTQHVLAVIVEGRDEEHLATMISRLEPILATVEVPARGYPAR